jgi:hypothetical protein
MCLDLIHSSLQYWLHAVVLLLSPVTVPWLPLMVRPQAMLYVSCSGRVEHLGTHTYRLVARMKVQPLPLHRMRTLTKPSVSQGRVFQARVASYRWTESEYASFCPGDCRQIPVTLSSLPALPSPSYLLAYLYAWARNHALSGWHTVCLPIREGWSQKRLFY